MAILLSAVMLGGIGGYAWSSLPAARASAPAPKPAKATTMPMPASPDERPAPLDKEWASRSDGAPRPATGPVASAAQDRSVHYAGCKEVRAAGKAPLYAGQPGYRPEMDGDSDGIACEPHRSF